MSIIDALILNADKIGLATWQTIDMVFTSVLIATLIGVPLGIFMSITKKSNPFSIILSFITNIIRSIPYLIFVIIIAPLTILIIGKSYGTAASKVPLTLISLALVIRTTEQSINNIPDDLFILSKSLGASKLQLIFNIILKEALPTLILGITTTIISVISYSTVMGIVAGGGLGSLALTYGLYEYNYQLLLIIIIILILIIQIVQLSGNLLSFYLNKNTFRRKKKR